MVTPILHDHVTPSTDKNIYIPVDGFLFLMIGTAMYNQLIDLRNFVPCVRFQSEEMKDVPNDPDRYSNIQEVSYSDDEADNERTKLLKGRR